MHSPTNVLLHVCCGPCATHAVTTLRTHHEVTMFFSNSNVAPKAEYELRLRHALLQTGLPPIEFVVAYDRSLVAHMVVNIHDRHTPQQV